MSDGGIASITLLGAGDVKWARSAGGLTMELPAAKPCDHAYGFGIRGEGQAGRVTPFYRPARLLN